MAKTTDRQVVNGETYEIMDSTARKSLMVDSSGTNGAIINKEYIVPASALIPGTYSSGTSCFDIVDANDQLRTAYPIFVPKRTYVYVASTSSAGTVRIVQYDIYGQYKKYDTITPSGSNTWFSQDDQYILINIRSMTAPSEYNGGIYIVPPENGADLDKINVINGTSGRAQSRYYFTSSATRLRFINQVRLNAGDTVKFQAGTITKNMYVELLTYDTLAYYGSSGWLSDGEGFTIPVDGLCTFIFKNEAGTDISVSDFDATVKVSSVSHDARIELEWGDISNDSNRTYVSNLSKIKNTKRSQLFMTTENANGVLCDSATAGTGIYIMFFGANQEFISTSEHQGNIISIPSNCSYIGIYSSSTNISAVNVTLYGGSAKPHFEKRVARQGAFPGSPSELLTFAITEDNLSAMRLILPSNYTVNGAPVPLIVWMRGSSSSSPWNEDFGETYGTSEAAMKNYIAYLRDEGFAVCAMKTFGSYYANKYNVNVERSSPYVIPTCILAMEKGIDYVCSRYNIDRENVHLLGHSQGGQLETYFVTHPFHGLRSIGMFSPVNDYLSMPGDDLYANTRKVIAEDLGLTGDTAYFGGTGFNAYSEEAHAFFTENIERINYLNEAWTGLNGAGDMSTRMESALSDGGAFWEGGTSHPDIDTIYTDYTSTKAAQVPVKIWGAPDDQATPYRKMVEIVKQFQNSGCHAVMRSFGTGTGKHHAATTGNKLSEPVTTKLGVVYSDLPVAWYEAIQFMRDNMIKP